VKELVNSWQLLLKIADVNFQVWSALEGIKRVGDPDCGWKPRPARSAVSRIYTVKKWVAKKVSKRLSISKRFLACCKILNLTSHIKPFRYLLEGCVKYPMKV